MTKCILILLQNYQYLKDKLTASVKTIGSIQFLVEEQLSGAICGGKCTSDLYIRPRHNEVSVCGNHCLSLGIDRLAPSAEYESLTCRCIDDIVYLTGLYGLGAVEYAVNIIADAEIVGICGYVAAVDGNIVSRHLECCLADYVDVCAVPAVKGTVGVIGHLGFYCDDRSERNSSLFTAIRTKL